MNSKRVNLSNKRKFNIIFSIFLILFITPTIYWIKNCNSNSSVRIKRDLDYLEVNEDDIENYNTNINNEKVENNEYNNEFKKLEKRKAKKVKKIKKVIKVIGGSYKISDFSSEKVKVHKSPYYDAYGIDLNQYIMDEMENKAINNDTMAEIEDWDLYTPPCPNLHPVHYPNEVLNPVCEDIAIPFLKVSSKKYKDSYIPLILRLHNITTQMEKWEEWLKSNDKPPDYKGAVQSGNIEYLLNDEYHPYDYGYYKKEINNEDDKEYYKKVIKSRMDEVPDPRRRRLFSMILFNSEFDLLDLYLAQYYEIFDYFIIYESNSTFSGYSKPLYLTRTLLETNRYEKFRDKIIPITLPVLNVEKYDSRGPGFPREHLARREVIEKGLRAVNARHGDIFIHGDLDELPKPRLASYLKKCGGWEHLLMGIGGGPKPMDASKSYLTNKSIPISKNYYGEYITDHSLFSSISFSGFFNTYSFNTVENSNKSTNLKPDLTIFDARRSLGQFPEYTLNGEKTEKEYTKILFKKNTEKKREVEGEEEEEEEELEKKYKQKREEEQEEQNFDPYLGYSYSDNTNDDKKGEGFLGEFVRFGSNTREVPNGVMIKFWKSSWHLSSFLPTIEHFLDKINSYSHFNMYNGISRNKKIDRIMRKISNHKSIFGSNKSMDVIKIKIPTVEDEINYDMFSYQFWEKVIDEYNNYHKTESFSKLNDLMLHEIPQQVRDNPICYSFMLDRDFGFTKKLWWQVIPKEEWSNVDFSKLDNETFKEISPSINGNDEL